MMAYNDNDSSCINSYFLLPTLAHLGAILNDLPILSRNVRFSLSSVYMPIGDNIN